MRQGYQLENSMNEHQYIHPKDRKRQDMKVPMPASDPKQILERVYRNQKMQDLRTLKLQVTELENELIGTNGPYDQKEPNDCAHPHACR